MASQVSAIIPTFRELKRPRGVPGWVSRCSQLLADSKVAEAKVRKGTHGDRKSIQVVHPGSTV